MAEGTKGTILIADDAETFRKMLGEALEKRGYTVLYAVDGLDAVRRARDAMPGLSLMVLDLLMPKMLGFDVLKELRDDPVTRDVPVLVATGLFRNFSEIERVRNLGAKGFLDKSLPFEEILTRIEKQVFPKDEVSRESLRVILDVPVTYSQGAVAQTSTTFTVSTSGLFIRTIDPLQPGVELDIKLRPVETEPAISCRGRVAYAYTPEQAAIARTPPGMGVEFVDISDADQQRLIAFVTTHLTDDEIEA